MGDLSNKLLAKRSETVKNERIDIMYRALHEWRAAIVKDMAARVAAVGTEPDDILNGLQSEMVHVCFVASALSTDPEGIWLMKGGTPQ